VLIVTKMKIYQAQNHNSNNGKCNVRYWHKADIPTVAAFFRGKNRNRRIRSARVEREAMQVSAEITVRSEHNWNLCHFCKRQ